MDTKALCLGILTMGDCSGYEIKKALAEGPMAHFQYASFGTIYPTLNRLEQQGFVTSVAYSQKGRPDKKVYSLTETGRAEFRRILKTSPSPERYRSDHLFMLFFGDDMESENRRAVRDSYVEEYRESLAKLESADCAKALPGHRFAHQLGVVIYRTVIDFLENHQSEWFDENERESDPNNVRTGT